MSFKDCQNKADKLYTNLYISALHQSKNEKPTIINKERIQILAEKFFSMSVVIDHQKNIYKSLTVSELILNSYIFTEKVLKTINRLSNRKTAESDRILNKVLKRIISEISTDLMQRIYTALICSLLLTYYKKSTIIILHKRVRRIIYCLKAMN